MNEPPSHHAHRKGSKAPIYVGVGLAVAAAGIWLFSQQIAVLNRPSAPPAPAVNLLPPPPPPPPPPPEPKEPPPPPDKQMDAPKPDDQPKTQSQPQQLTINGPAQAGGDAFGIGAGKGGGSSVLGGPGEGGPVGNGGGFAEAAYRRFMASEIQQAVQANSRIDHAFNTADVAVWMSPTGRVTHVKIRKSTGDAKLDGEIVATLEHMAPLSEPPPPQFQFPREVTVRGARS